MSFIRTRFLKFIAVFILIAFVRRMGSFALKIEMPKTVIQGWEDMTFGNMFFPMYFKLH